MNRWLHCWLLVLLAAALSSAAERCHSGGKGYQVGDDFIGEDGCSVCICTTHGSDCNKEPCIVPPHPTKPHLIPVCEYNGRKYEPGQTFPPEDGCGQCKCVEVRGRVQVACTDNDCAPRQCAFRSRRYRLGQEFEIEEGCIKCQCQMSDENRPTVTCGKDRCAIPTTNKPRFCRYNSRNYEVGDRFPAEDGCNECTCEANEHDGPSVHCTEMACMKTTRRTHERPLCRYNDQVYKVGERFPAGDGCNKCICEANEHDRPSVSCTEMACMTTTRRPPVCRYNDHVYEVGDSFPAEDGCNECICRYIDNQRVGVICTKKFCETTTHVRRYCEVGDRKYELGASFNMGECRECTCTQDGVRCIERVICKKTTEASPQYCIHEDDKYKIGDVIPMGDNCNTCTCTEEGLHCTQKYCKGCTIGDKVYKVGDTFKDDCAGCECTTDGVKCKDIDDCGACVYEDKEYSIGDVFKGKDDCNSCKCTEEGIQCSEKDDCKKPICKLGDRKFKIGDIIKTDNKNKVCYCKKTGIECKLSFPKVCKYKGKFYKIGTKFYIFDGCKTCQCLENAKLVCSESKCPNTEPSWTVPRGPISSPQCTNEWLKEGECRKKDDGECRCCYNGNVKDGPCNPWGPPVPTDEPIIDPSSTDPSQRGDCSYNAQGYTYGDRFLAEDGCNSCLCTIHGPVCSNINCTPQYKTSAVSKVAVSSGVMCLVIGVYQLLI